MIKTCTTIHVSRRDIQRFSFLINKTQLGLLSTASQRAHIQTSHRPLQLLLGIEADEQDRATGWQAQQEALNKWAAFLSLLDAAGLRALDELLVKYQLKPDLLVCYDQHRLKAWLPLGLELYLLREGRLLRLKPIERDEPLFDQAYQQSHACYSVPLAEGDYFLLLPPDLPALFQPGEIADLLLGLRQLPAKMSELMALARLRGLTQEDTWLAIEIVRKEEDTHPPLQPGDRLYSKRKAGRSGRRAESNNWVDSASETLTDSAAESTEAAGFLMDWIRARSQREKILLFAGLALVLVLTTTGLVMAFGRRQPEQAPPTDPAEPSQSQAAVSPTPLPTPTATPAPTEPVLALVVTAQQLNLREAPGLEAPLIKTLQNGDQLVQLAEPEEDWVAVRTADGLEGYVYAHYVAPADP